MVLCSFATVASPRVGLGIWAACSVLVAATGRLLCRYRVLWPQPRLSGLSALGSQSAELLVVGELPEFTPRFVGDVGGNTVKLLSYLWRSTSWPLLVLCTCRLGLPWEGHVCETILPAHPSFFF